MITKTLTVAVLATLLFASCSGSNETSNSNNAPLSEVMEKVQKCDEAIEQKDFEFAETFRDELVDELAFSNELTSDEKIAIGEVLDKLDQAKAKEMKKHKAKLSSYKSLMSIEKNEFDEVNWNRDKSSPTYNDANGFYLYFGTNPDGSAIGLRLRVQYYDEEWLFHDSFKVLADGKTQSIFPEEVKRDSGNGGKVWEWSDEKLESIEDGEQLIVDIINSKNSKIRFQGDEYYSIKEITPKQKEALKNVVFAFVASGGYFGKIDEIK